MTDIIIPSKQQAWTTEAAMLAANPVIAARVIVVALDTLRAWLGDGVTAVASLPVWLDPASATGDFSTSVSTSVASEVVLFDGTTGKLGKRATGTGWAKLTAGVLSAAAAIAESDVTGLPADLAAKAAIANNLSDLADATTARWNIKVPSQSRVIVVATSNQTLSGLPTVDGVTLVAANRLLLTGQSTGSENGIWQVQSGAWTRPADFPSGGVIQACTVLVAGGTVYASSVWAMTHTGNLTIDSGSQTWAIVNTNAPQTLTNKTLASGTVGTTQSAGDNSTKLATTAYADAGDATKQPLDSDLTTIAGLTATTDNFMQAKSSAWASRTVAQVKTDLGLTGTNSGDQTITLTGDVTGSGSGSFAATVANDAVTYAKMQNVSATDKLLGRATAGAGDVEEIALTAAGRALIDDADAAAQRTTLGLGTIATKAQTSGSAVQKADGSGGLTAATAGTDYAIPGGPQIDVYSSTGSSTWTKPTGAKTVHVFVTGAGGGGGAGRKGAAAGIRSGGGGGAGGMRAMAVIAASTLGSTETAFVGTGGTGGPAQTTNATNGVAGTDGTASYFGAASPPWVLGYGGKGGTGGDNAGGVAGGAAKAPGASAGANAGVAGAAGLTADSATGGGTAWTGGGGGSGGSVTSGGTESIGGGGSPNASQVTGATGGTVAGGAGGAGVTSPTGTYLPGGGGAGGGSSASVSVNAGAGGVGGAAGGGGGGGGGGTNGANSGAGGNGADGRVVVVTYFT